MTGMALPFTMGLYLSLLLFLIDIERVQAVVFRDCWLLFGGVDDVGWTHATNLGRLAILRYMRQKYTDHTFESMAYPGTFFLTEDEREEMINQTIAQECNLILAGSDNILNGRHLEYASEYPNISFTRFTAAPSSDRPINFVEYIGDWLKPSFVAGAVAATTSHTCAGFINALESAQSAWAHAMGFTMGYHWIKPHQPVHVVTMDSYYNPPAEVLAAQLLVEEKGCDVLGRHTDPNDVDKYVLGLDGQALSIARYVDMSTFVGDTVFTSQVIDFFDYVLPSVESAFLSTLSGTGGPMYTVESFEDGTPTTRLENLEFEMQLSPFTSAVDSDLATTTATMAREYLETNNPLCDQRWRQNGEVLPLASGEPCPTLATLLYPVSYLLLPNTSYYDSFQDGGALCGAGQYYSYDSNLTLTCLPCPENTFYTPSQGRARTRCFPCENGTIASIGSSQCVKPSGSDSSNTAAAVGYALGVFVLALFAAVIYVRRKKRDNRHAPKHSDKHPIAIMFTDIQGSTTIWAQAPEAMARAVDDHHRLIRKVLQDHQGYEVKTIGDAFMVVHSDIAKAVSIALAIQRKLHDHDWGTLEIDNSYAEMLKQHGAIANRANAWNGLRIRVGIAFGTCDGDKDPVTRGYDYYGTCVNTAARAEAAAHGGQVLLTRPGYDALLSAFPTEGDSKEAASIPSLPESAKKQLGVACAKSHGAVRLRGLSDPVELIELIPVGFEERTYPPLRVDIEEDGKHFGIEDSESDNGTVFTATSAHLIELQLADVFDPDERMHRLVEIALRMMGVKRHDLALSQSVRSSYDSIKALLSLHSEQERRVLLKTLMSKWRLVMPTLAEKTLQEIGGVEVVQMLMLSVRAGTISLAQNSHKDFLATDGGAGPPLSSRSLPPNLIHDPLSSRSLPPNLIHGPPEKNP